MSFIADLHIHSKYSRATSRDLDPEHLVHWAAVKGIDVVGTGDCVHPGWLMDLKDRLEPAGGGLYRLRPELEAAVLAEVPLSAGAASHPRFLLTTEISTIYKKGDKTRKVHHVVLLPDFDAADRFAAKLAAIGNIASDGRPILGLDSRDLLEIVLEVGSGSFLIPAHIWTPWFSALGAKSGFESIDACYGDLADHIFAVETGLSSDPEMNWRISALDKYRLISNSDAHSPSKLGREATIFTCEPGFSQIRRALETGEGYGGTIEFFPEEGKYHFDGHRACDVRLSPKEAIEAGGICPVCGKPLTMGVAHRVEQLADRAEGRPPVNAGSVQSLVPLPEMIGEIFQVGPASKRVGDAYQHVLRELGPEFSILSDVPTEDIAKIDTLLAEAVTRLRAGQVRREGGYDGVFGTISLFEPGEIDRLTQGNLLFDAPMLRKRPRKRKATSPAEMAVEVVPESAPASKLIPEAPAAPCEGILKSLDPDQAAAAACDAPAVLVTAGPGAGKTRMLTFRLAHLVLEKNVDPQKCLAITFTRRATEELKGRLMARMAEKMCRVHSYHSLALEILRNEYKAAGLAADFRIADESERKAMLIADLGIPAKAAGDLIREVSLLKRLDAQGVGDAAEAMAVLSRHSAAEGWLDFDDLVIRAAKLLEVQPEVAVRWRYTEVAADEFQDIDPWQYRLLKAVSKGGRLCVIGDPDQAIYGFRGADHSCFAHFRTDFPDCIAHDMRRNYRSAGNIVTAAAALMGRKAEGIQRPAGAEVELYVAADARAEADMIAHEIETLMGGHDMLSAGRADSSENTGLWQFSDFAVLYRTDHQADAFRAAFDAAGIPYAKSRPTAIRDHAGVRAIFDHWFDLDLGLEGDLHDGIRAAAERARAAFKVREGGLSSETSFNAELTEASVWMNALADRARDFNDFREKCALALESDFYDPRADRVALMTMHAAKGLEFPVVFIPGMEQGLTPFIPGNATEQADLAEEKRIFYVAMTRARDRLILFRARRRYVYGEERKPSPSAFLESLPLAIRRIRARPAAPRQYSLF